MMRVARSLVLFALVPVFAGCQMFSSKPADTTAGQTRLQGELVSANDQLIFQPCVGQQRYAVRDSANTTLVQDATDMPNKPGKLFADIRGNFIASKTPELTVKYRCNSSTAWNATAVPARIGTSSN